MKVGKFEGEMDLGHLQHFKSDLSFWCEIILIDHMLFLAVWVIQAKLNKTRNQRKTKDVSVHISKIHYQFCLIAININYCSLVCR